MHSTRVAALVAAACLVASAARAQAPAWLSGGGNPQAATVTSGLCDTRVYNGATVGVPCAPGVAPSDPANASYREAHLLTSSGTAGTAGTLNSAPYPATSGTSATATAGRAIGYVCPTAGTGSVTLADKSVIPYSFAASSGMIVDVLAAIDAEPPSGVTCSFAVLP